MRHQAFAFCCTVLICTFFQHPAREAVAGEAADSTLKLKLMHYNGGDDDDWTTFGSGSGFIVTSSGHVLTAKHIATTEWLDRLEGKQPDDIKITGQTRSGQSFKLQFVKMHRRLDAMLFKILGGDGDKFDAIAFAREAMPSGTKVTVLGFPEETEFDSSATRLPKLCRDHANACEVEAKLKKGYSGGPVVEDENGTVIGLVQSSSVNAGDDRSNFIPAWPLVRWLDDLDVWSDGITEIPCSTPSDCRRRFYKQPEGTVAWLPDISNKAGVLSANKYIILKTDGSANHIRHKRSALVFVVNHRIKDSRNPSSPIPGLRTNIGVQALPVYEGETKPEGIELIRNEHWSRMGKDMPAMSEVIPRPVRLFSELHDTSIAKFDLNKVEAELDGYRWHGEPRIDKNRPVRSWTPPGNWRFAEDWPTMSGADGTALVKNYLLSYSRTTKENSDRPLSFVMNAENYRVRELYLKIFSSEKQFTTEKIKIVLH